MTAEEFLAEISERNQFVKAEREKALSDGYSNHERQKSLYYSEGDSADEESLKKDDELFQAAREGYKQKVENLSKMLRHQRNMKRIRKDCFKNMIAEPLAMGDEKSEQGELCGNTFKLAK